MSHLSFHLSELFWSLFYPLLFSFLSFFLFGHYFQVIIYFILIHHAHLSFLLLSNPLDAFFSFLNLSTLLSLNLSFFPLFIFHLYFYLSPSLIFLTTSTSFELLSLFFLTIIPYICFYITLKIFPYAIQILLTPLFDTNEQDIIYWIPQINSIINLWIYTSISTQIYIWIPILLIYLQINLGNPSSLPLFFSLANFSHFTFFFLCLILALITPPDLISLFVLAIPFILLFELSFFITLIVLNYSSYQRGGFGPPILSDMLPK